MPTGVYIRTEKHKAKMRGRKLSKETKMKMSLAKKGKIPKNLKQLHLNKIGKKRPDITGKNNYLWKGGKYKHSAGYIIILKPEHPRADKKGYIYEHILIMEKHLRRYVKIEEQIHHLDGNKSNNDINNLHLFANKSEHTKYYIMLRGLIIQEVRKSGQIFNKNVVNQYV